MDSNQVWKNLLTTDFDYASLDWQDFREGVDIFPLHGNPAQECSSALLRYRAGAKIPRHLHIGTEFLIILRGSQADERGHYNAGTFLINPTGSSHELESVEGCILLAIWEKPVKFI